MAEDMATMQERYKSLAPYLTSPARVSIGDMGPLLESNISAKSICKDLLKQIREFDESLAADEEVSIKLVSFGQATVLKVTGLGYCDPNLILFYGYFDDNSPAKLIQHISQLNFLIMSVKRKDPDEPKKPIGFIHPDE